MISDIATILWKEFKEIVHKQPSMRGGWISVLIIIGVYGILMPLQLGVEWVRQPILILLWLWLPFLMVSNVTADTIAGERERHTLETLLASRLPDTAILFGKVISAVLYGWGITLASLFMGLVTVNIAHGQGELLMFPGLMLIGLLVLTLLAALLAAGLGVLVSLRAATVRQAQQTMSLVGFIPMLPIFILPMLGVDAINRIMSVASTVDANLLGLGLVLLLLVVDIALLALAMVRFQRSKLILD
jgi:ABC-2 type transport system permease protein